MYSTFGGFSSYFKKKKSYIDNATFRLHYRTTFALLVLCSLLVTMGQFFGAPIQCMVDDVPDGIMNTYCWIHGTFTIPSQLTGIIGEDVPHPAVAPLRNRNSMESGHVGFTEDGDEIRHAWYQWVCFILFFQAILCYFPHYLWKSFEGGKLVMLIGDLDTQILDGTEAYKARRTAVVQYFIRAFRSHNPYVFKFLFCEVLNIVNILFQIYLMDVFFNGQFTKYGAQVVSVTDEPIEDRDDPMNRVFPKVTKCTFRSYGPSGTIEIKDGLCILAMNIINEKIYVLLWFWYITLTIWTGIHLMVRVVTVASRHCRFLLFCNRCKTINHNDIQTVLKRCQYGDWFILMQLAKHINPAIFHELVLDLRDRFDAKRAGNVSED